MRPKKHAPTGAGDLFRARLECASTIWHSLGSACSRRLLVSRQQLLPLQPPSPSKASPGWSPPLHSKPSLQVGQPRFVKGRPDCSWLRSRFSVVVAWNALLCYALIFHRRLEHHAVRELIDHAALDLLPWRLTCRIGIAASLL